MKMKLFKTGFMMCIMASTGYLAAKVVDMTVAVVNGEAIFKSELEKNVIAMEELQKKINPAMEIDNKTREGNKRDVLDQMIDDKLMLQEAKKMQIKVVPREVEKGIKQVKDRFKRDEKGAVLSEKDAEEAFKRELKKEGITYKQFEDRIRDQVMVISLIDQEVKAKADKPTDQQIKQLFQKLKQIIDNKKVTGLSEDEERELKSIAFDLHSLVSERVRARHILVRVDPKGSTKEKMQARRKISDVLAKLKNNGDFAQLAREYSEDTESAANGGELGFFVKGMMVKAFEDEAFKLSVGEISDIVETEFGYHIIRVEEKKAGSVLTLDTVVQSDGTQKVRVYDLLENYVFQQNAKNKFEDWIKKLRTKANIQIKDDTLKKP